MPEPAPVRCARQGFDAKAIEADVVARWNEDDVPAQYRTHREGAEKWYFVDGPPYTSGHIHLGTAWNKVMKDLLVRHRTMLGYHVRDQPGYDMHGLPIEVKVERELGISNKKEIEALGIEAFVAKCKAFSLGFLDDMTEEFKELGVWLDWPNPYRTIDDSYIEGAWWTLKRAHEKGLLYTDERGGLSWCPRCETALAQAEIEYADRQDPSIFVKFPVDDPDQADTYLVIWTTTPWTLPANNAVAVHPDLTYAKVLATTADGATETLIVEDTLVELVCHEGEYEDHYVVEHMSGSELEGLAYVHPFRDEVPYHQARRADKEYTVILGEHVTAERTGLVHTATGHGAEDFEVGRASGIPPFCPVGPNGYYNELAGVYRGLKVGKDAASGPGAGARADEDQGAAASADETVIAALDEKGLLLAQGLDTHSYGHCWRCKTPILYLTTEQWFLAVTKVKDKMLSEVERIKWTPAWAGAARQRDWVENARDWTISRQRFWGIPLPIWRCEETGEHVVVGSKDELLELSGAKDVADLHRPWVDEITIERDGKTFQRVPDVLDVWFDSAVASWASLGYPADETAYKEWFPSDLIIEGLDQTRGWFYSQLAAGVVALDRVPYEEVVMHGFVHDQEGRPMSKSVGNIVAPRDVIAEHGVDALRWALLEQSAPWEDVSFGPDAAKEAQRVLNILWNVHYFSTQYMALDGYTAPQPASVPAKPDDPLDAWFVSRVQATVSDVAAALERHEYHRGARAIRHFVLEDLSRWYVRINRDRAWKGSDDEKRSLYDLLAYALGTVAQLMAPYAPHVADAIWSDLHPGTGSVHLTDWPVAHDGLRDEGLEGDMALARAIVEGVGQAREKAGLSLRWPVPRVVLVGDDALADAAAHLADILEDQCNAKAIEYAGESWGELTIVASPVRSTVGPTFKQDAGTVMDAIRNADGAALKDRFDDAGGEAIELAGFDVTPDMVEFTTEVPEGILGASFQGGSCFVDAHLSEELEAEGLARELLRRIQEMRKAAGLDIEATVGCTLDADPAFLARLEDELAGVAQEARVELATGPLDADADGVAAWEITNPATGGTVDVRLRLDA